GGLLTNREVQRVLVERTRLDLLERVQRVRNRADLAVDLDRDVLVLLESQIIHGGGRTGARRDPAADEIGRVLEERLVDVLATAIDRREPDSAARCRVERIRVLGERLDKPGVDELVVDLEVSLRASSHDFLLWGPALAKARRQ